MIKILHVFTHDLTKIGMQVPFNSLSIDHLNASAYSEAMISDKVILCVDRIEYTLKDRI